MNPFQFNETRLEGLKIIQPFFAEDDRGYFMKNFEWGEFLDHHTPFSPYEIFFSKSKKGTIRGMHFQYKKPQDKLVFVVSGSIYDVAVDLRKTSKTAKSWEGFSLSDENHKMIYIPQGFAHGFQALEDNTIVAYVCGSKYDASSDTGVLWEDKELAINWPIQDINELTISEKDRKLPSVSEFVNRYGYL
jgi:dTDP-4-dehydrorhamnose 3,5-epimerase